MANLKDFATGTVASAPSPATTGTSVTLQSGEAARMPEVPFYATAHPDYQLPTLDNAEKILVTAKNTTTNVLTITRAQGNTTAKSIANGWRISNSVFADDLFNTSLITGEVPGGTINSSNTTFTTLSAYTTGSLKVHLNGQRLRSGASNDYVEVSSGFTMNYAPATGDVLSVDYTIGSTAISDGVNSHISDEAPIGTVNGSNTAFSTQYSYVANTLEVFINGLKQARTTHVTETNPSTGAFTLDVAPATGDIIRVNYQHSTSVGGNADTVDGNQAEDLAPVGAGMDFWGTELPTSKWMFPVGQAISRTAYPTLFARLGTTYGAGDGSTTFNLPDKRGRVSAGQDDMGGTSANRLTGASGGVDGDVLGGVGGAETHTLTANEMPSHRHTIDIKFGSGAGSNYGGLDRLGDSPNTRYTDYVGGGAAHNNVQPTIICNYIIKVL